MRVAVILGLLAVITAVLVVMGRPGPRLAATNTRVNVSDSAITVGEGTERCQGGEYVPREAVRLRVYPGSPVQRPTGEPLAVSILDGGGEVRARASVPGGYSFEPLEVPVSRRTQDLAPGVVCIRNLGSHPVRFARNINLGPALAISRPDLQDRSGPGARPDGEVRVDYLRAGRGSWWSLAPEIAKRFELFKASLFGSWTMWALLGWVLALWAGAILLLLRTTQGTESKLRLASSTLRRLGWLPAAGWACAGIAFANATAWAAITPTFQVPDEPSHVGYARYLAARGRPPPPQSHGIAERRMKADPSEEFAIVLNHLPFSAEGKPSWSKQQDRHMRRLLDGDISRVSRWDARAAANYPPAYHALQALPARFAPGDNVVDRLFSMRLVSALLAGLTVAFVYLFLRELLPGTPWSWVVGSLAVAFQPVFGFMAGGVNNDILLYAAGAVLLFATAKAFRSGLTPRLGLLMGGAAAAGVLSKTTMAAMLPGVALAVAFLIYRGVKERSVRRRPVVVGAITAGGVFLAVTLGWYLIDTLVFHRPPGAPVVGLASADVASSVTLKGQLSYLWQSFLPALPFMAEQFRGYPHYLLWDHYIEGFIGRFGWFQYGFPLAVNQAGFAVLVLVAALAIVALLRRREAVRRRWAEITCYVLVMLSMLLVNGIVGYRFRAATGLGFEQPRYLFSALALYGAVVALAAQGVGRRWGPAVGAFLLVAAMGHSLFAMLITLGRYYA